MLKKNYQLFNLMFLFFDFLYFNAPDNKCHKTEVTYVVFYMHQTSDSWLTALKGNPVLSKAKIQAKDIKQRQVAIKKLTFVFKNKIQLESEPVVEISLFYFAIHFWC